MRTEMTCWSKKRMLWRPICLSILSCLVVLGLIGGAGYALGAAALKDGKLALSLPEVVIESPDIERLIAQRVRPVPPKQLGVRMPNTFPQAAMPAISLPPRPLPKERDPDMELTKYLSGIARLFGNFDQVYETGLAFFKKGSPVEALTYFNKLRNPNTPPHLKAAGEFWGAETLIRLGKKEEARLRRSELRRFSGESIGPYPAAARYALADERCRAKEYDACLKWLNEGEWPKDGFAGSEAPFLQAWALIQKGGRKQALQILSDLKPRSEPMALRVFLTRGHLHFHHRNFSEAIKAYSQAQSLNTKEEGLIAEALHGRGWAHLHFGQSKAANRVFSTFLTQFPQHRLRLSAEAGAVAAILKIDLEKGEKRFQSFAKDHPRSRHIGPLRLQLAWAMFQSRNYGEASKQAAWVSDDFPLGRLYRLARVVEGLSYYHQGKVRKSYGVLRTGAEQPPAGTLDQLEERSAARSAAMATAFAAFRLKDYSGAQAVLEHWAFFWGAGKETRASDAEAALWYGEAAFEAGNLERARRAFEKVPKNSQASPNAKAGMAWIHYRKQEWEKAAEAFDQVFLMKPSGPLAPEALARGGEARFNLGDYSGALQAFERIEKEFAGGPVAQKALLEKGKLLFRRNRYEEASQAFSNFLKNYPDNEEAMRVEFWNALIPFRQGRYKQARERLFAFTESYSQSPLSGVAYLRIGDAFYNERRFAQADRMYRLMRNRYPKHPRIREATYGLILTRLSRNNHKRFISDARKYIERYGDDDLSIALGFQIGEVLLSRGDLKGALQAYREVETRHRKSDLAAHALLRISDIYRQRKEIDASLDAYESLMTRYPRSPLRSDALFGSGETLARIGRCREASVRLADFLKQYPKHDYKQLAQYELGRCAARDGKSKTAVLYLKKTMASADAGSEGLRASASLLLASILVKQKRLDEASQALNLALNSSDPAVAAEAYYSRAEILARRKDRRAAAEFLKLTYKFPEQTMWVAQAYGRAAELYETAGRRATALRIFQKMHQVAPRGPLRIKAQKAIKRLKGKLKSKR